jgi:hypothetical protein
MEPFRAEMPTQDGLEVWQEWMEDQLPAAQVDSGERPLEDDTSEWGPFFWSRARIGRHQWPIAIGWAREIGGKFRFGWGIRFRDWPPSSWRRAHTVGIWWRDKAPQINVAALIVSDPNYDEEEWSVPAIPINQDRKSGRMPWTSVIRDRNLRRPGQNLAQFLYYQLKARRLAKQHEKQRQAEAKAYQNWADHIDDYAYSVGDSAES